MKVKTQVYRIDSGKPSEKAVNAASEAIIDGKLVVFPTETVYGIGANAFSDAACREIYIVKGRAPDNPLIVHVYGIEEALRLGRFRNRDICALEKVWPGPLTVIVNGRGVLPDSVTAGLDSVAIRCPDSSFIRKVMKKTALPIAAPSANISTKPSSTKGEHAIGYFKGKVPVIIDGGESDYGIESTVLDLRSFRVLRPGAFTVEQIEHAFGRKPILGRLAEGSRSAATMISPGTKYRHYSPEKPLFVYEGGIGSINGILGKFAGRAAFIGSDESCRLLRGSQVKTIPLGPSRSIRKRVHRMFGSLIELDSMDVSFGVIESFPKDGIGYAAMNRLKKASDHRSFKDSEGLQKLVRNI